MLIFFQHSEFSSSMDLWVFFLSCQFPPHKKHLKNPLPTAPASPCAPDCHGAPQALITPFKTQRGTARSCPQDDARDAFPKLKKQPCPERKSYEVNMFFQSGKQHILTWVQYFSMIKCHYFFWEDVLVPIIKNYIQLSMFNLNLHSLFLFLH